MVFGVSKNLPNQPRHDIFAESDIPHHVGFRVVFGMSNKLAESDNHTRIGHQNPHEEVNGYITSNLLTARTLEKKGCPKKRWPNAKRPFFGITSKSIQISNGDRSSRIIIPASHGATTKSSNSLSGKKKKRNRKAIAQSPPVAIDSWIK